MKIYIYIILMAVTTYLLRVLPLTVMFSSFLYVVRCACLAALTCPAMLGATVSVIGAAVGFGVAFLLAYLEKSLVVVAASSCAAVFVCERIIEALPGIMGG